MSRKLIQGGLLEESDDECFKDLPGLLPFEESSDECFKDLPGLLPFDDLPIETQKYVEENLRMLETITLHLEQGYHFEE